MQRYLVVTEMGPGQAVGVVTVDSQEMENDLVGCHVWFVVMAST